MNLHFVSDKFRATAFQSSDTIALAETNGKKISYSELEARVEALTITLKSANIEKGHIVAVLQKKSCEHIACLLSILRCDATVVPIDPLLPTERVHQILRDLHPDFIISNPALLPLEYLKANEIIQQLSASDETHIVSIRPLPRLPSYPAYILFTSGSTGTPKGVCISHEAINSFVNWGSKEFSVSTTDRVASIAPTHFDLSIFDIYVTLTSGATLYLYDSEDVKNARLMTKMISDDLITSIYATPSFYMCIPQFGKPEKYSWQSIRQVMFAGEVFPVKHLHALMQLWSNARFYNLYGPTETNVCTWHEISCIDNNRTEPYPIGKLCDGLHSKISEEGELNIGGAHVAEGYFNSPQLTAAKFFEQNGMRWYRTGDTVRMNSEGNLEYTGRIDRQIKRRGYRIEPLEVEIALQRYSKIIEAAVTTGIGADKETMMLAFVLCTPTQSLDTNDVKTFLFTILPEYMVPDRIYIKQSLPKTSNGKIDYAALQHSLPSPIL